MRNMSFFLTEQQVIARTKTVTRRRGWLTLTPGDRLCAVRKSQGIRTGEGIVRLAVIEVVDIRRERLDAITPQDVVREGFPSGSVPWFVEMFCQHMITLPSTVVTRIEFEYVD